MTSARERSIRVREARSLARPVLEMRARSTTNTWPPRRVAGASAPAQLVPNRASASWQRLGRVSGTEVRREEGVNMKRWSHRPEAGLRRPPEPALCWQSPERWPAVERTRPATTSHRAQADTTNPGTTLMSESFGPSVSMNQETLLRWQSDRLGPAFCSLNLLREGARSHGPSGDGSWMQRKPMLRSKLRRERRAGLVEVCAVFDVQPCMIWLPATFGSGRSHLPTLFSKRRVQMTLRPMIQNNSY